VSQRERATPASWQERTLNLDKFEASANVGCFCPLETYHILQHNKNVTDIDFFKAMDCRPEKKISSG
jgi:hypothetical protein